MSSQQSPQQLAMAMFYSCGLEKSAAVEAAGDVTSEELRSPPWALYHYWMRQNPAYWGVGDRADLNTALHELKFRPEIIALNDFGESVLGHMDARLWARRLAASVYSKQNKS
ncbi:hypothetical protein SCP_1004410 [Sparassis crispa]|uniref:Uncharacterized protein n=1 Tax=Sparassis crispa TaxID=139825 RepID=A0A401GYJ6_9APHY|nr:hypothetical protein SCP_1004410 [Sparassis crispa]GBE87194.1 hypothetical protein SCP_1004410 [Sparassis crispa]